MCQKFLCKYMSIASYNCGLFKQKKCFLINCMYQGECTFCKYKNTNICLKNLKNGKEKARLV